MLLGCRTARQPGGVWSGLRRLRVDEGTVGRFRGPEPLSAAASAATSEQHGARNCGARAVPVTWRPILHAQSPALRRASSDFAPPEHGESFAATVVAAALAKMADRKRPRPDESPLELARVRRARRDEAEPPAADIAAWRALVDHAVRTGTPRRRRLSRGADLDQRQGGEEARRARRVGRAGRRWWRARRAAAGTAAAAAAGHDAALQLWRGRGALDVSRDTPNKGRAYFHCAERRCGFFAWADGEQRERIGRR